MNTELIQISEEVAAKQRRSIYLLLYIHAVIYGLVSAVIEPSSFLYEIVAISIGPVYAVASIYWCLIDKKLKGKMLGFGWFIAAFFIGPLLIPIYFIKNYGFKDGGYISFKIIGIMLGAIFVAILLMSIIVYVNKT